MSPMPHRTPAAAAIHGRVTDARPRGRACIWPPSGSERWERSVHTWVFAATWRNLTGTCASASLPRRYMLNDSPQPQLPVAFGFTHLNP